MRAALLLIASLGLAACVAEDPTGSYRNALDGQVCTPNDTYTAKEKKKGPGHCQGTSNGDNCDDLHSGKIDCIGDGNSGQGDDRKHNCEFPQPGCDDEGCCDGDMIDPPADDPPADPPPDDPGPVIP